VQNVHSKTFAQLPRIDPKSNTEIRNQGVASSLLTVIEDLGVVHWIIGFSDTLPRFARRTVKSEKRDRFAIRLQQLKDERLSEP